MTTLGARGDAEVKLGGKGALPGAARKDRTPEHIAKRVAGYMKVDDAPRAEGVQPLNCGFFCLERMRTQATAKRRAKKRTKVRG